SRREQQQSQAAFDEAERSATSLALLERGLDLCAQGNVDRGILWMGRSLESAPPEARDLQAPIPVTLPAWPRQPNPLKTPILQHEGKVLAVAFRPDGKTVLTGSEDNTARLWDAATGQALGAPLQHSHGVGRVAFSPDGQVIVTVSGDNAARLWDAATGQ